MFPRNPFWHCPVPPLSGHFLLWEGSAGDSSIPGWLLRGWMEGSTVPSWALGAVPVVFLGCPLSAEHEQAFGAHRKSGGPPKAHFPGSGSKAGCAGPAPLGIGIVVQCPPHSAAEDDQIFEPGAAVVEARRTQAPSCRCRKGGSCRARHSTVPGHATP